MSGSKYHSWIKAGLAVLYTKEGIEPFVYDEIQQFQLKCLSDICYNNRLMSGATCSMCCTENVVICPTNRICNARRGRCGFHKNAATQYNSAGCPNKICDNLKTEIQNAHRYYGPSYRNTDSTQWCSNPWEVAKCFMPPDGYKDVTSAAETDFNGINSVIINYKGFQAKVIDNLGKKNNIFEKAREISRDVRHSPNLEVDDTVLQQYFTDLQNLLSDPGYLATNIDAQNAKQKLIQLQNDTLVIGKEEVRKVLDDVAKLVQVKIRTEIDKQKKEAEKQKLDLLNTSRTSIDALKNQEKVSLTELSNVLSSALRQLKEKTEESVKAFEAKTAEEIGKIKQETHDSIKTLETKTDEGVGKIKHDTHESIKTLETKTDEGVEKVQEEAKTSKRSFEDETRKGVKRIKTIAEKEQKDLTETVKKTVTACNLQKQEEMNSNLQEDLIQHYREQYSTLPITPLLDGIVDVPLLEMYVPPFPMDSAEADNMKHIRRPTREGRKMEGIRDNQTGERQKVDEKVKCKTLSDVFNKNKKSCKNIYITAEPGFGKSSFVKWLVLTWCQARNPLTEFKDFISDTDLQQMREFEFVFLVLLRDTQPEETHVDKMIANYLISLLGRQSLYTMTDVEKILSTRKCLIILDGLDEWRSSSGPSALPNRAARETCSYITTSRPWKMATLSIKSSQIDQLIQIKDLQSICTNQILPKVLNIFIKYNRLRSVYFMNCCIQYEFLEMLKEKKIEQFAASPVMLMQILYLWNFDKTVGNSQCQIYSNLVDALLARAVEKGTVPLLSSYENVLSSKFSYFANEAYSCDTYYKLLLDLGNVAFQTLFSGQVQTSLVFQKKDLKQYVQTENNDEFFDTVVKVGLLSQEMHMTPRRKEYSYSFYHKTIQEYFAALYIQSNPSNQYISEKIMTRCNTISSILEMGTVFMFLSGFNPQIACEVLQSLQSTINDDPGMKKYRNNFFWPCSLARNVQNMICNCVEESRSNGHELLVSDTNKNAIQFPLCDIVVDDDDSGVFCCSDIKYIIKCNGSKIKSLNLTENDPIEVTDLMENLTYSNLEYLEYLYVTSLYWDLGLLSLLHRLVYLKYIGLDGQGFCDRNELDEEIVLGPDMKHIESVQLSRMFMTDTAFHVLVDRVLTFEHSVTVTLSQVTVLENFRTIMKQEETVKHDISTLPTLRGQRSNHGLKTFDFEVVIPNTTLQEFVYIVEKCQHPVKVTLKVLEPDIEYDSENDDEKLDTTDEYGKEGLERVQEYIRCSGSFVVEKDKWGDFTFVTKYKPENSDNDTPDESD